MYVPKSEASKGLVGSDARRDGDCDISGMLELKPNSAVAGRDWRWPGASTTFRLDKHKWPIQWRLI